MFIALGAFLSLASNPVLASHAIDKVRESPLAIAPPFRTLHQKFPIESLRRRFAEGIITTHPTMPQFWLDADQISDVLAYIQTLQP